MEKSYKFRLYPSKKQVEQFDNILNSCRYLYNIQLEYERYVYEKDRSFANRIDLNNLLPDLKIINPSLKIIHSQVLQNVNDRVIKSFNGFFSRVKKGMKAGYPRFKNFSRYNSFTFPQSGFTFTSQKKIKVSKIGEVSIRLHRNIKGKIKTLTIMKTFTGKWFACFCVVQDATHPKRELKNVVGMDLGLTSFAKFSDKSVVKNPRHLEKSLDKLRRKSRRLSMKKKGSFNRFKSRFKLALLYEKVSNQRTDFLHKLSRQLVNKYDGIALENLTVLTMKSKWLQRSIRDVSWDKFRQLLTYKAENTGCKLDFVNPKNTSKTCSKCGSVKSELKLSERTFICPSCGFSCCRDLNASFNILNTSLFSMTEKLTEGTSEINACEDERLLSSAKQEATTSNL